MVQGLELWVYQRPPLPSARPQPLPSVLPSAPLTVPFDGSLDLEPLDSLRLEALHVQEQRPTRGCRSRPPLGRPTVRRPLRFRA